jgi:hypothetical protein
MIPVRSGKTPHRQLHSIGSTATGASGRRRFLLDRRNLVNVHPQALSGLPKQKEQQTPRRPRPGQESKKQTATGLEWEKLSKAKSNTVGWQKQNNSKRSRSRKQTRRKRF